MHACSNIEEKNMTQPIEDVSFKVVIVPDTVEREADINAWFKNQLSGLSLKKAADAAGRTVFIPATDDQYDALDMIVSDSEGVPLGVEAFLVKDTGDKIVIDDRAVKLIESESERFSLNTDAYADMFYDEALEGE